VKTKSLGLIGMRERVRLFSGELDIRGIPDQGTTVVVKILDTLDTTRQSHQSPGLRSVAARR